MKPTECIVAIADYERDSIAEKERKFKEICSKIQPVFQHFFYERYKNPGQWFERRLAYTTSVAVSSMVGHILGIGDRHVNNILVDQNTAELIHIDFGIAFEQGKILPHKELVPFRLTRDILAPMGVCGTEGVFRQTCEATMSILRQNHSTLSTILEVLLYDPMYTWTSTTKQARRQLRDSEDYEDDESSNDVTNEVERNSMASRALLKIQEKLKGLTDDSTSYSSVEGQVNSLIQKAISTNAQCQLFKGWQAFL